jgi:hypothetical protein
MAGAMNKKDASAAGKCILTALFFSAVWVGICVAGLFLP